MGGVTAPQNTVYADGGAPVTGDGLNTFVQTVTTVSDLRAFIGVPGMQAMLEGTSAIADNGQGVFYWNADSTAADDNGITTVVPYGSGAGAWTRLTTFPPVSPVLTGSSIFALTAAQSIPSGAYTPVVWDTILQDPFGFYQAGSLIIPAGRTMRLRIASNLGFAASTAAGTRGVSVTRNGSNEVGLPAVIIPDAAISIGNDLFLFSLGYSAGHNFNPGDSVGLSALQDTGSSLDLAAPNFTWIQIDVVG